MAYKKVKCRYCGEYFDKENTPCMNNGTWYYHKECYEKKKKEDENKEKKKEYKEKIHKKISEVCGDSYLKAKVNKQIKQFVEEGMKESGIYNTLVYWYDIKNNSPANANGGIGIVPYVYKEAADYWIKNNLRKKINDNLSSEKIDREIKNRDNYNRISIKKGHIKKPKRVVYFNLD